MTALQARLYAARALRAAREQEHFARQLRPETATPTAIPRQRTRDDAATPRLTLVPQPR